MNARAIDIMHELEDTNTALQRARAELAIARKVMDKVADQRDAARAEAAEYRTMIDRCRERNKELGAEADALRAALQSLVDGKSEFDIEYDTGMPADEARKIMDLAYQRK